MLRRVTLHAVSLTALLAACGPPDPPRVITTVVHPELESADASGGRISLYVEAEDLVGPWATSRHVPGFAGWGFATPRRLPAAEPMRGLVEVPIRGIYQVWARGWEGNSQDRRWRIRVGSTFLEPTHPSRSRSRFSWQHAGEVTISKGLTTLEIHAVGGGWVVADAIVLSNVPGYDPREREARFRVFDPVEAEQAVLEEMLELARTHAAAAPPIDGPEAWEARAEEFRPRVMAALGLDPLPEATPLSAEILGVTQQDGYRVERVTFESRPGFLVTALVLVPDGPGPFPAVLRPIGHWGPKSAPVPLAVSIGLARQGYLVLTYDPFGQGERAISGNGHAEHLNLTLTGRSNMTLMVWDSVRAVDYLLSRDDVDPLAIGLTGASGGGLNTLYTSVVDPRISLSVPVVYVTQWEQFLETGHYHDPCSHVPGMAEIADMGELAALFAPKPQMFFNGTLDTSFTTVGAELAALQAGHVYELMGASDHFALAIFEELHDYSQSMRETFYGFADLHLRGLGDGAPRPEAPFDLPPTNHADFTCFEDARLPPGTTTARDLARGWAQEAAAALPEPQVFDPEEARKALLERLQPPRLERLGLHVVGEARTDGLTLTKLRIETSSTTAVPALLALRGKDAPTLVVPEVALHTERHPIVELHAQGFNVLYVSPRGWGETAWDEYVVAKGHILLGRPIIALRAAEIDAARRAVGLLPQIDPGPVGLLALSPDSALAGLYAQALYGGFDAVALGPMPSSYLDAFTTGISHQSYVARILEVADIPQLVHLAAERPITLGFSSTTYRTVYPAWAPEVEPLLGEVALEPALDWLRAALKR